MIEVRALKAKNNLCVRKNGTFLEDELYFGRPSKDGMGYVVRSEEGYWIPFFDSRLTFNRYWYSFPNQFEGKATIYMKNRKRLNQFDSVEDYIASDECEPFFYNYNIFKDKEFYL